MLALPKKRVRGRTGIEARAADVGRKILAGTSGGATSTAAYCQQINRPGAKRPAGGNGHVTPPRRRDGASMAQVLTGFHVLDFSAFSVRKQ